jgi:hypothetical protein
MRQRRLLDRPRLARDEVLAIRARAADELVHAVLVVGLPRLPGRTLAALRAIDDGFAHGRIAPAAGAHAAGLVTDEQASHSGPITLARAPVDGIRSPV